MKRIYPALRAALAVCTASAVCAGCATGKPLTVEELNRIGWEKAELFQCYLSSRTTLTKLPDASAPEEVEFTEDGAAAITGQGNARYTIVLPASLEGRVLRSNQRDQYLYVAFEEGGSTLPFAKDSGGYFSLVRTRNSAYEQGTPYVEYEGFRYKISNPLPRLHVIIRRAGEENLRRTMQGVTASASSKLQEVIGKISGQLVNELPEQSVVAVLEITMEDKDAALFVRDELEYQLAASKKFSIVERSRLNAIRSEQKLQASGEVSDESAVSMGRFSGANIVITGALSGSGASRRLTIKALDVETAVVISTAREPM